MSIKNKLISFEGIDGSGKSTQVQLLEAYLDSCKLSYISVREPGSTKVSEKIRDILLNKTNIELTSVAESLLFLSARAQLVDEQIQPALSDGKFVLCDRYIDSTIAYQGYGRGLDIHGLYELNSFATSYLVPELTFIVDIDAQVSQNRTKGEIDRMESAGSEFLSRVRNGYHELVKKDNERYKLINGIDSIESIQKQILNIFKERFEGEE
jgi:dTMP kinase